MAFEVVWRVQGGIETRFFMNIFDAAEKVQQLRDRGIENWLICTDIETDPYLRKILDFRVYPA